MPVFVVKLLSEWPYACLGCQLTLVVCMQVCLPSVSDLFSSALTDVHVYRT